MTRLRKDRVSSLVATARQQGCKDAAFAIAARAFSGQLNPRQDPTGPVLVDGLLHFTRHQLEAIAEVLVRAGWDAREEVMRMARRGSDARAHPQEHMRVLGKSLR
jgi:hypothetical protein